MSLTPHSAADTDTKYDDIALVNATTEIAQERRDEIDEAYLEITTILEEIHTMCENAAKVGGNRADLDGLRMNILESLKDIMGGYDAFGLSEVSKVLKLSKDSLENLHSSYALAMIKNVRSTLARSYLSSRTGILFGKNDNRADRNVRRIDVRINERAA